jgi:cytochrome c peroxidase
VQIRPADNALVRLGQVLFFSQSFSGSFDASCGTCHHPDFGTSDGLSISVGVVPFDRNIVGPGRAVDPARDLDPSGDRGPNMHRNSPTMFNAALHDRALFFDGRVFVVEEELVHAGFEQEIRTPEHGARAQSRDGFGLLESMGNFPMQNDNEMRGYLYADLQTPGIYREQQLLGRLRGERDTEFLTEGSSERWLALFRAGFDQPAATAQELIKFDNVRLALAAYIKSQIFVDTPWRRYIEGSSTALSAEAKRGAVRFLADESEGGLGCASCHSGDRFSGEGFANVGFPQMGRGFRRADKRDMGRWSVTRHSEDLYAFRVPSLLNVALTAPYGHAGTFDTLERAIRYHANPRAAIETTDFTFQDVAQIAGTDIVYPHAEPFTRDVQAAPTFDFAEAFLPARDLTDAEVSDVIAFLNALTDDCAGDHACVSQWTPSIELDPDGHMLVRNRADSPAPVVNAPTPADYPPFIDLNFQPVAQRTSFPDVMSCPNGMASATNDNAAHFKNLTGSEAFGLTAPHGYSRESWYHAFDTALVAGGVSAGYLDDDCWPDLAYAGGDDGGLIFYRNRHDQDGFEPYDGLSETLREAIGTAHTGVAIADLDGDYRRELVIGNLVKPVLPILSPTENGQFYQIASLPMTRPTFGVSFGMLTPDGYPSMYMGHWGVLATPSPSQAFMRNEGGARLVSHDVIAHTTSAYIDQDMNFSPAFADFRNAGVQDLVIASDFNTSRTLVNNDSVFDDVTERAVISDENGMGSAVGDYDNDGKLDWFVTSVRDHNGIPNNRMWGLTGNRLYRNVSTESELAFEDVTYAAGVDDGFWGWGACAADFNHDGFLDIFHVNGFGRIPDGILLPEDEDMKTFTDSITKDRFQDKPSRLFINQRDGTFVNAATDWQIDMPSEGRGITCFDYDRDGDIDIALVDHSNATGIQFFENQIGHGLTHRFLNVRVVGAAPNTDALGARVTVVGVVSIGAHALQSQLRVREANTNYNGQNLPDLHFGMGVAPVALSVTVEWPGDPEPLVCYALPTNRFLVFDQRDKACPRLGQD